MRDDMTTQDNERIKVKNGRKVIVERGSMKGYYAVGIMLVLVVALILCLTVFFKVKTVEIDGLSLYTEEQIVGVGGISNGQNLVRTDLNAIKTRLEGTLVYIDNASVTKKYPSTIVVTLTQAQKAADIECNDSYYVLSTSGKILEAKNPKASGNIPVVKGFELKSKNVADKVASTDEYKASILVDILNKMNELGYDKVTEINMVSRSDITLIYDGRIIIEIGSSVDLDYKLNYFKAVIDDKLTDDFKGRLIYNGAESGISAIPDTADAKKNDSSSSQLSSSENEQQSAATNVETDYGTDTQYEDNGVAAGEDYGVAAQTTTTTTSPDTNAVADENAYADQFGNNNGYTQ